jgi:hypothetical protein
MARIDETIEFARAHYVEVFDKVVLSVEGIKDGAFQVQHYAYTDNTVNPPVDVYVLARRSSPDSPRT